MNKHVGHGSADPRTRGLKRVLLLSRLGRLRCNVLPHSGLGFFKQPPIRFVAEDPVTLSAGGFFEQAEGLQIFREFVGGVEGDAELVPDQADVHERAPEEEVEQTQTVQSEALLL
jgi:hypothetical protein